MAAKTLLFLTKLTSLSHLKERKEKNCLNCNAQVDGRFCHICGQENLEPEESVWHLITHFFNDITHFDGKFFSTLKLLVFKPGFLSAEYKMGRRNSYLNPVRMYIFTSFVFFFIFFSTFHVDEKTFDKAIDFSPNTAKDIRDSTGRKASQTYLDELGKDSVLIKDSADKKNKIFYYEEFASRAAYDSVLKLGERKDSWLKRQLMYKQFDIKEKYNDDQGKLISNLFNILLHNFPQMLFVSLPLFALFLKLIYFRQKQFYLVSHGIYTVHLYIFYFIVLLLMISFSQLSQYTHWAWLETVAKFLIPVLFYYEYKAMRNFYGQGRGKTILKFVLVGFWRFIIVILLFLVFLIFSFLKV